VFGRHVDDVVYALARDEEVRLDQRLRVDRPVDGGLPGLAEREGVDVRRGQGRLVEVGARAGAVVVVGEDVDRE